MKKRNLLMPILTVLIWVTACEVSAYDPSTADQFPTVTLDNGILSVELNGSDSAAPYPHYPGVTRLSVLGTTFIPFDNAGANLQFAVRSAAGDDYNPTLEGDCGNRPSQLFAMLYQPSGSTGNWIPAGTQNIAQNGALMGVTPLRFAGSAGQCPSSGVLTPYAMNFAISLGSGAMPPQAMIMEMQVHKTSSSATDLVKDMSELPAAYGYLDKLQFAYYSTDLQTFQPANAYFPVGCTIEGGAVPCNAPTNDLSKWPIAGNVTAGYFVQTDPNISVYAPTPTYYGTNLPSSKILMLCDAGAVTAGGLLQMTTGICMAYYSEHPAIIGISRRQSFSALALMGMGNWHLPWAGGVISDTEWHTMRRLLAVGNPGTILSVVNASRQYIDGYSGTW